MLICPRRQTINGWLFLSQTFYIPQFYQLAYGYSALKAGALLLPLTVAQSACAVRPMCVPCSLVCPL